MNNRFKSPLAHMPLLQSFQTLELRTPYHLTDLQPFSIELMSYTQRVQFIALAFFIAGLLAISTTISYELWLYNPLVTAENALLELAQGGFLLLAAVVQGVQASRTSTPGLQRDIRVGLALFAFMLFLREVDIDRLGASAYWDVLEKGLRALALLLMLGFIVHMSRRFKTVLRNLGRIFLAPTVVISAIACVLYAAGWLFDKELFSIDKGLSLWFEETLELNACLLLLFAGFARSLKFTVVSLKAPSL